ncbi:MAG TPA: MBL fold metallo-hydrolase [Kofleriaceae bacterium]|nr:MBL fold metallo-hydrolase [Kofleriaceae bacterium]
MFATTFLGHQGWMIRTDRTCLLIDPLLREDFGDVHAMSYRVFPPRVITAEAFPAVHAVLLSHEHDDHFDIPSLARLDRAIPIYLSVRSSSAARDVLAKMGFTVAPWIPGVAIRLGDLEALAFSPDLVNVNCGDEWDTLPYLIRSTEGHGSFFSMVDIPITEQHVEWAAATCARPGLVSWTNNALDWSHMADYLRERTEGTQEFFLKMGTGHKLITTLWGAPAAMMTCAGGFSFHGDKAWLNQRVFCVDTEAVCGMMGKLYKKEKFVAALPGQTFVMQAGKLKAIEASTPFLATAPREHWPSRAKAGSASGAIEAPDYAPATGRRALAADEEARLVRGLGELAGALVGGNLFKSMFSLLASELGERKPTFVLLARTGDDTRLAFEYVPTHCTFVRADEAGAEARYLAGLECWASDLLAVLEGAIGGIALIFGRARLWNAAPKRFNFDVFGELCAVSHPLRRPAEYAETYDRAWHAVSAAAPDLRAAAR